MAGLRLCCGPIAEQALPWSWSAPVDVEREKQIAADRPIYFISDLHLGDGTRSDIFMHKDRALLELLARVREEGARLVIVGDAIDFYQAWGITRVLKAHGQLLRALSDLADRNGVIYIYGNHDHDIALFHELFRWEVCARLRIGGDIVVQHGHQADPLIGPELRSSEVMTRVHHLVERLTGTWVRMPLHEFYTPANRFAYWMFHKAWMLGKVRNYVLRRIGLGRMADEAEAFANYWVRSEAGDPMEMLFPTLEAAKKLGASTIVSADPQRRGVRQYRKLDLRMVAVRLLRWRPLQRARLDLRA
jgi:UDP-2,3-diacylglucosamine pyrophosphatase LpxH